MNQPLVSIFVSSYNHEKYIEDCLKSIFNQTYRSFEVIIRDDGSTDNTVEKIKGFLEKLNSNNRIVTEFGSNIGLIKSLNWIFKQTEGEILQGLASDDILMPKKVERVVELFSKFPEIDLLLSDAEIIDSGGKKLKDSYFRRDGNYFHESFSKEVERNLYLAQNLNYKLAVNSAFGGLGMSYRKRLFQCHDFQLPEELYFEDNYITFLGLVNKGVIITNEKLLKYRRHGHNFSSFNKIQIDEILKDEAKLCHWNLSADFSKLEYFSLNKPINPIYISKRKKMVFLIKQNQLRNKMVINLSLKKSYFLFWLKLLWYSLIGPKSHISFKYLFYGLIRTRFSDFIKSQYINRKKILI